MHGNIKDLTNQRFGRLLVISLTNKRGKEGGVFWLCRCDCGNLKEVVGYHLFRRDTKSCGCLKKEKMVNGELNLKHGETRRGKMPRLYRTWLGMKMRCYNTNVKCYRRYGGRGISVCKEWIKSYMAFRTWALLNGYADNLTIDKIDNNGNYEPDNCQWLTRAENIRKYRMEIKGSMKH